MAILTPVVLSSVEAFTLTGWKLEKKLVFTPYSGFGELTISHFNEALWQWNKESSVYNLQRAYPATHNDTNFYTAPTTSNKIFKVNNANSSIPAVTLTTYDRNTKKVISADICLNGAVAFSNGAAANTYDVWTVFIHEVGHVLGFDHSALNSVMNTYPAGTIKRYLTSEDKAGIASLYG